MKEPTFLTLAEVLEIHHEQLTRFGGSDGVRDLGLLESAIAVPQASFGGVFLHSTLYDMAAAYAYHIAENQPFVDGNKRTALGAALIFLDLNEIELQDPQGKLYEAMMKMGTRQLTKEDLSSLLKKLSV